jgi:hypothetical protein
MATLDPTSFPAVVTNLTSWPKEGVTYSYENRGYILPKKLQYWLEHAFGKDKAKYRVSILLSQF